MINPQWLELPMSRTIFHGPKDVQAIKVRLYFGTLRRGVILSGELSPSELYLSHSEKRSTLKERIYSPYLENRNISEIPRNGRIMLHSLREALKKES